MRHGACGTPSGGTLGGGKRGLGIIFPNVVWVMCPAAGWGRGLAPCRAAPHPRALAPLHSLTRFVFQDSDGDKSDDLVVDVSNEVSHGAVSAGLLLSPRHGRDLRGGE